MFALGAYRWVAVLADGTEIPQFDHDGVEISVDKLKDQRVAHFHMVPLTDHHAYIRLDLREDERLVKKWVRTFTHNLDTNEESEHPVIDTVGIETNKQLYHYIYGDGSILITSSPEPI